MFVSKYFFKRKSEVKPVATLRVWYSAKRVDFEPATDLMSIFLIFNVHIVY